MKKQNTIKWRTILGLVIIYLAMWFNWMWLWGVLFFYWVIPDIFSGVTFFMESIDKKSDPILYWVIMVSWILMGGFCFALSIFPEWITY